MDVYKKDSDYNLQASERRRRNLYHLFGKKEIKILNKYQCVEFFPVIE